MSQEQRERERAQRIKDAQLRARDPGPSKIRGYDWAKHTEHARQIHKPKPFLKEVFDMIPARWKGLIVGFVIGGILGLFLGLLVPPDFRVLALVPIMLFSLGGFVIGKLVWQEERFTRW